MGLRERETRAGAAAVAEAKKPLKKRIVDGSVHTFLRSDTGHKVVRGFIGKAFEHGPQRLFDWEGLENVALLKDHIAEGRKVLLIANHTSHADAVPVTKLLTDVRDLFEGKSKGIVYTMAGSMKGGQQGVVVQTVFEHGVEPYFGKVGVTPDYVVSENDRTERQMGRPEDNGKLTREAMLDASIVSGVHIEGKTKGGKVDPDTGKLFGLQEADRGFKGILLKQWDDGVPTVILPVMVEGGDFLFNPITKNFTLSGLNTIAESLTVGEGTRVGNAMDRISELWFGDVMRYRPGTVKIGTPRTLQEIHTRVPELGDNVMRLLAQVASPRYRGEYGNRLLAKAA